MNRDFASVALFARHIDGMRVRERSCDEFARSIVGHTLVVAIKSRIGRPEFFKPLAASTLRRRRQLGFGNTPLLMYGKLYEGLSTANTAPRETGVGDSAPYAIYQELGGSVPGRPPKRSFMASAAREKDRELFALFGRVYRERMGF